MLVRTKSLYVLEKARMCVTVMHQVQSSLLHHVSLSTVFPVVFHNHDLL